MSNIHRTARGVPLDLDRLKTINEQTVAVGNAGVNARGDLVKGTKVIKTREQIARESYNIRGNNVAKDINVNAPIPDVILEPIESFDNPNEEEPAIENIDQPELSNEARGGLANALNRSNELAEKLAARKRI